MKLACNLMAMISHGNHFCIIGTLWSKAAGQVACCTETDLSQSWEVFFIACLNKYNTYTKNSESSWCQLCLLKTRVIMMPTLFAENKRVIMMPTLFTQNCELPWCHLCHWWHWTLLWQPVLSPVMTKLALWQLLVFSVATGSNMSFHKTVCCAANDDKVGIIRTLSFQCTMIYIRDLCVLCCG